jgi:hypothetical protein
MSGGQSDEAINGVIAFDQLSALGGQVFWYELKCPLPGGDMVPAGRGIFVSLSLLEVSPLKDILMLLSLPRTDSPKFNLSVAAIYKRSDPRAFRYRKNYACRRGCLREKAMHAARIADRHAAKALKSRGFLLFRSSWLFFRY